MGVLTESDIHAIARLVTGQSFRPDWDHSHTLAALFAVQRKRKSMDAQTVAVAAIYASMDPMNESPLVIPEDGAHWAAAVHNPLYDSRGRRYANRASRQTLEAMNEARARRDPRASREGYLRATATLRAVKEG